MDKRRREDPMVKTISFHTTEGLYARVWEKVREEGKNLSDLLRSALEDWLAGRYVPSEKGTDDA
jgi:hypothetical protein